MKNTKVSKVLLIFTFIISMLINLTPVYAANKKVKMPERAVDGSRLIYSDLGDGFSVDRVSAVSDGKYIYYTTNYNIGHSLIYKTFKRNIKTRQETGITRNNYSVLYMYKNILLGNYVEYFSSPAYKIEKISKTGKVKELAVGYSPIGWGNSIYYIGEELVKVPGSYPQVEVIGLYKMNVNGKRKKLVKKRNRWLSWNFWGKPILF